MMKKLVVKSILLIFVLALAACGGLRFSQAAPEAVNFHPKKIRASERKGKREHAQHS